MNENNSEISEEQRQAVREKYGATQESTNGSLSALGWIAALGLCLAVIAVIIAVSTEDLVTFTLWSGMVTAGVTVAFFALIAYLAVKAVLTDVASSK